MKLEFDPKKNITNLDYISMHLNKYLSKLHDLLIISKIIKNWQDVLLFRLGLKANIILHLKTGQKIKIKKPEDYFNFWDSELGQVALLQTTSRDITIKIDRKNKLVKFKVKNKIISFYYDSQKQMTNTIGMIKEQFLKYSYSWLDVKRKNVVDIGANIGDAAIYFALKSAKHVYAFEPYPYSYNLAIKNTKLNSLQEKITILNEGCSGKERTIRIDKNYTNIGGTDLKKFDTGKEIKIMTLRDIIKRFNLKYPTILKIDCEGCEYGVLLDAQNSDLRKFEQIMVEYHYGYLNLKMKLESAGFKVSKTFPKYSLNIAAENKEMIMGYIYAERK
ncbi:MAG: FkbM family methyltransferase [Candidatus Micrarchaeaceae archaeon]